jgi:hypothetical protein
MNFEHHPVSAHSFARLKSFLHVIDGPALSMTLYTLVNIAPQRLLFPQAVVERNLYPRRFAKRRSTLIDRQLIIVVVTVHHFEGFI